MEFAAILSYSVGLFVSGSSAALILRWSRDERGKARIRETLVELADVDFGPAIIVGLHDIDRLGCEWQRG